MTWLETLPDNGEEAALEAPKPPEIIRIPVEVEVSWDPNASNLKPEAVPGLVHSFCDAGFGSEIVKVTPLVAMPENKKTHLPGCICCDPDGTAVFGEGR